MKSFAVSFVVLATVFASSAFAQQRLVQSQGRFMLTARVIQGNLDRREAPRRVSGNLALDIQGREATLSLNLAPICPPTAICAQFFESKVVSLPLVSVERDERCGGVIYTATKDLRPVDGPVQTLIIRDNTSFRCPTFAKMAPTEVILKEMGPRASFNEERISTFDLTPLTRTLIPFIR